MSKKILRSPSYPSLSLRAAVEAVGKIEARYRTSAVDRDEAAKLIGFSRRSGPANQALASLASYGLLERAGKGDARVTHRAREILHPNKPEDRIEHLEAAALTPPLFQELRDRFPDVQIPPESGVVTHLNRRNFNPSAVPKAAQAFLDTVVYLEELKGSDSHDTESSNGGESPSSGETTDTLGAPCIGDAVQWESQGALQFAQPRRVRAISEDGDWVFVDGSETGIPMNEVSVESREPPVKQPPTLPLSDVPVAPSGEVEWLRSRVGKNTSVRLMVIGDVGSREVGRLIRVLETQRDVLQEDEGYVQNDKNA